MKLFGTDGVRGKANTFPMTGEIAFKLGQAAAKVFGRKRAKVVIAKDTRRSSYIFEYALTSGLCSMGADVYLVGPAPTPAVAHLVRSFAADFGIMITASHNPAGDNGIKFFDSEGFKLEDDIEQKMEDLIFNDKLDTSKISIEDVGKAFRIDDAQGRYIEYVKGSISNMSLKGLKIVLDCANGAAYKVAPLVFRELGADVIAFGQKPDGLNINKDCGALYPDIIREAVLGHHADLGIAFDGDADRVIMADSQGNIVDGDKIMALIALHMKSKGCLKDDSVVYTQYSNIGLDKVFDDAGIKYIKVDNGDRYIVEQLRKRKLNFGGEKSGHIIMFDYNPTGDGLMTAVQVLRIMKESGKTLNQLSAPMKDYPQVLKNVIVKEKPDLEKLKIVQEEVRKAKEHCGKVFLRYSGTEPKCRVLIEGEDQKTIERYAKRIADAIKKEIGA